MEESFSPGHQVELLRDGRAAFPAMLDAIAQARRRVLLEMYWIDSDSIGCRFRDALVDAARRGAEVRVLFDAIGSLGLSRDFFPRQERLDVQVYNPLGLWRRRLSRLSRRDHRKLLVADDVAFTGGINLAEAWAPPDGASPAWRDDAIRVRGPAVLTLSECFWYVWRQVALRARHGDWPSIDQPAPTLESPTTATTGAKVAVLPQALAGHRRFAFHTYLSRVRSARHRIWIANAYFLPNRQMTRALREATSRGVDVRIIVPGISDVEIVRHASRAVWGRLLHGGAHIYEFQPSILHSKTAVIDSEWSTIGSYNLDYRSLRSNLELNVSVLDRAFAQEMESSFERDLDQCLEVDRRAFIFRSLGDRLLERIAYWFRSWL